MWYRLRETMLLSQFLNTIIIQMYDTLVVEMQQYLCKNARFHRLDLSEVPQHYPHHNSSVTSQNRKSHCYFSNSHNPCDLNRLFGISWGGTMEPQTLLVWSYFFHEDYYLQLFQVTHKCETFNRLFTPRESDSDFGLKKLFLNEIGTMILKRNYFPIPFGQCEWP